MEFIVEGKKFNDYNDALAYEDKLKEEREAKRRAEEERINAINNRKANAIANYRQFLLSHISIFEAGFNGSTEKKYIVVITDNIEPYKFAYAIAEQKFGLKYKIIPVRGIDSNVVSNWTLKQIKDSVLVEGIVDELINTTPSKYDTIIFRNIEYTGDKEDLRYVPCECRRMDDSPYSLSPENLIRAIFSL